VEGIQTTVTEAVKKNQEIDESFISRHFCKISRMTPDSLDLVVATLANSLEGLGIVVKKIAAKAREETGAS
jgi:hypothetical protein